MFKKLMPAVLLLGALSVAGVGNAADCEGPQTYARFLQPQGGMAQVKTTPTGAVTVNTGGLTPAIFISTTGSIDVEIEHACLLSLTLAVYKDDNPTPIHTNAWEVECGQATKVDEVPIGLDGGNYTFQLGGTSCNGKPLRESGQGGVVGDPPIL